MTAWNPNSYRRSDVALLARGSSVFGSLPRVCRECQGLEEGQAAWTHKVIANTGSVSHLTRLIRNLETGNGRTFCGRLFKFTRVP